MKKILQGIVVFFTGFLFIAATWANEPDSLRQLIDRMPMDTTRLAFVYQQMSMRENMNDGRWARILLQEAKRQNNSRYEAYGRFALLRYYYMNDTDSMGYCLEESEPVFLQTGLYEQLFRAKGWYIYALTRNGRQDEVLSYVGAMKEQAGQLDYPAGEDMADQALANFYITTGLPAEGIRLYEEILEKMEREKAPLIKRYYILRQLITVPGQIALHIKYLQVLKNYIDRCQEEGIEQLDAETPLYIVEYTYYRTFAVEYINLYVQGDSGVLPKVLPCLRKAQEIARTYKQTHFERELQGIYAYYYVLVGRYAEAAASYDSLATVYTRLGRVNSLEAVLGEKARVFHWAGRYKEAADAYKKQMVLKDSLMRLDFREDLARMNARHQMDKLELQNQKMEMEAMKTHTEMAFLWSGLAVLALICCLLGYMVYVVHRFSRQLKATKEKAEEADRLKSAFLANMNHEIRTPLNAIIGFSDILVEEDDPACRQEYAQIIHSNNELLQRLVNDVLDISKIESNTIEFTYSDVNLPSLMKEIHRTISLSIPEGIELILDPCLDVDFYTDRSRLTQILTNFLTNATKHTKKGYICFGYEVIDEAIQFYVKDTGEGIPEEQWERIFSRFVKLTEWTQGVGLGLAISKALVTKMNGQITVSSEVGKGSTFCVVFPLRS